MHRLRIFLALLLGAMIVAGLMIWYRQHPDRQVVVDPLQPLWSKIELLATRVWWKTTPEGLTTVPSTRTTKPLQWSWALVVTAKLHPEFIVGKVALADLIEIVQTNKTFGEEKWSLILLQWCDFGSSYCIESYEQGSLFAYMNAFPDQLSYQLKWYLRDTKPETMLQHKAASCAESLASKEVFLSYYFNIYQARGTLSKDDLLTLAERLTIDWFANCLETKNMFAFQQEMKRARTLFGFSTLPANVLVNKKTGQYVLIPGLYETPDVLAAIQWLSEQ